MSRNFWTGCLLFVVAFLSTANYWNLFLPMNADEAVISYGAERLLSGEWIYRDWDIHLFPGSFVIAATWFKLVGLSSPSPRVLASVVFGATTLLIWQAASFCLPGRWKWLPVLLWCTLGIADFPILSYHWMAGSAAMATLCGLLHWADTNSASKALPYYAAATGAMAALATWILQSEGLVALLMIGLCALRLRLPRLHLCLCGYIGASAILWVPFLPQIPKIIADNIELGQHLKFNRSFYSWSHAASFFETAQSLIDSPDIVSFWSSGSQLLVNTLRYLGLPFSFLIAIWASERRGDRNGKILSYALFAWFLGTANRHTPVYIAFLNPCWVLLLAYSLRWTPGGRWLAAALAALEVLGWTCRTIQTNAVHIYPIATRRGILYSSSGLEAVSAKLVLQHLQQLPVHTDVLVFPYGMHFYWMAELHNPTRWMTQVPRLNPEAHIKASRQALIERKVEWLLYIPVNIPAVSQENHMDPIQMEKDMQALYQQMTEGYEVFQAAPTMVLLRRNTTDPPK